MVAISLNELAVVAVAVGGTCFVMGMLLGSSIGFQSSQVGDESPIQHHDC